MISHICGMTSLVAQMVKCLPTIWETWVWSLGREDPLEKAMATHSNTLASKSRGQRSLAGYSPGSCKESDTTERLHFPCVEWTYLQYRLIEIENRLWLARWRGGRRRGQDFGVGRCRLLHLHWINKKVLMYRELSSISCGKPQWLRI